MEVLANGTLLVTNNYQFPSPVDLNKFTLNRYSNMLKETTNPYQRAYLKEQIACLKKSLKNVN